MQIKDFGLGFGLEQKVFFIAIFKTQIGFLGVKTRFFINFFRFFEAESVHFASFFGPKKASKLRILAWDLGWKKRWFL